VLLRLAFLIAGADDSFAATRHPQAVIGLATRRPCEPASARDAYAAKRIVGRAADGRFLGDISIIRLVAALVRAELQHRRRELGSA
jgi:hypothetical protein